MNWDTMEGKWTSFKGKVKEQWGKLTDDDLDVIKGRREQLAGRLQQVYGFQKEKTEQQICEFEKSCECK